MARSAAAVALALVALAGAQPARAEAGCGVPPRGHLEARTKLAVVYSAPARRRSGERYSRRYIGCLESEGVRFHLTRAAGDAYADTRISKVKLAGVYAAYVQRGSDRFGLSYAMVHVIDLRRRAERWFGEGEQSMNDRPSVPAMVLARDGAVAYTIQSHGRSEVRARDAAGQRTLDSGDHVRVKSLRLHRRTVTWRHGVRHRSAKLR
jgi:hypothetical protein